MRVTRHSSNESLFSIGEMRLRFALTRPQSAVEPLDVVSVHQEHAEFVWLTLQRLGIRDADLDDVLQEVFVVVHRRLSSFDGSARVTTWLFGICVRVASAYRRRAHRRREESVAQVPEAATPDERSPEQWAVVREAHARLLAALDRMDLDKRAIFVMFEFDELACEEIAEMLSIPLGTVYSRLHAARQAFRRALDRVQARERSSRRRDEGRR